MRIYAIGVDTSPDTWIGYEQGEVGRHIGTQAPTDGVYLDISSTVWNHAPTPGEPTAWMLAAAGANGGTWDELSRSIAQPETATGTITLLSSGPTSIDSSGGAVTATLGSGDFIGQSKTIVMTDASNSSTVSISLHQTSDPEVATFDAVDETGVFMWTGTEWVTIFATCTFV